MKKNSKWMVLTALVLSASMVSVGAYATNKVNMTDSAPELIDMQKDIMVNKMLNSMDYFDELSGVFTYQDSINSKTVAFGIDIASSAVDTSFYEKKINTADTMLYVCNDGYGYRFNQKEKDSKGTYTTYQYTGTDSTESPINIADRITVEKDGSKHIKMRKEPAVVGTVRNAIYPQQIAIGFLILNENWEITDTITCHERECNVVEGTLSGDYSAKLDVVDFTIFTDKETGIIMDLKGYNTNDELTFSMYFDEISFAPMSEGVLAKECENIINMYLDSCEDISLNFLGDIKLQ